jgi:hypothetical protein
MLLVEALRLRWWAIWWAAIVLVGGSAIATLISHSTVDVNNSQLNNIALPITVLGPIAMFLTMIFATSAGLSLNREGQTLALSWTKPVPRPVIALRIIAVDVAALAVLFGFAWLVAASTVTAAHGTIVAAPAAVSTTALSFGVALMWYALCEALTAGLGAGGRSLVGFLWPVSLVLSSLGGVGGIAGTVIHVLNVFNPLAYLRSVITSSNGAVTQAFWVAPPEVGALVVLGLSVVLVAVAVVLWTRREA